MTSEEAGEYRPPPLGTRMSWMPELPYLPRPPS